MPIKIPDNVTNPKTLRKWKRYKEDYEKWEAFAKEKGYKVFKSAKGINPSWSFSKNGFRSAHGFDSPDDVLRFIFTSEQYAESSIPNYHHKIIKANG